MDKHILYASVHVLQSEIELASISSESPLVPYLRQRMRDEFHKDYIPQHNLSYIPRPRRARCNERAVYVPMRGLPFYHVLAHLLFTVKVVTRVSWR